MSLWGWCVDLTFSVCLSLFHSSIHFLSILIFIPHSLSFFLTALPYPPLSLFSYLFLFLHPIISGLSSFLSAILSFCMSIVYCHYGLGDCAASSWAAHWCSRGPKAESCARWVGRDLNLEFKILGLMCTSSGEFHLVNFIWWTSSGELHLVNFIW